MTTTTHATAKRRTVRRASALLVATGAGIGAVTGVGSSCATTTPTTGVTTHLQVRVDDEIVLDGPAAWSTRRSASGPERVIRIEHVGEVLVDRSTGDGEDDDVGRCRFVWARAGVQQLSILTPKEKTACALLTGDRLCFPATHFVAAGDAFPRVVVVEGCARQNELFLDALDGAQRAGLAPVTFVERCEPIDADDVRYLRLLTLHVDGNDTPLQGARFRHDGERFELCFLGRSQGHFEADVVIEDATMPAAHDASARTLHLAGEIDAP